ncbi:hypothetical protein QUC32_06720 [Novosphingobium resinovorum]|uniref:hypothetical protein n=1 Tax=Novosphingobium TaxID=165696 RepID=UPI0005646FEC|nr:MULTISPECIES: hypothetical protein [Novosphingobium]MBF7014682.1 hypothetical protein [Novosphingobium sp. HR1a]WJM24836.1 hypothetical protein QUC32_06720 [Novosphingobium resinovorum]
MLYLIVALFVIMWVLPSALTNLGVPSDLVMWIEFAFGLLWFVVGGVRSFMIACPNCGRSLFIRHGFISVLWPPKRCSKCDLNLIEGDA